MESVRQPKARMSIISRMNNSVLVTYLYLVLGLVVLAIFIGLTMSTFSFQSNATQVKGAVVEIVKVTSSTNSNVTFYPKVEYFDQGYNKHLFVSNSGSSPSSYKVNDAVEVLYIPKQQGTERIKSFVTLWAPSLLLFIIGSSFVLYSLFNLKRLNRKQVMV
jgi:hypothetical protein